jgi:hypothetical protein
MVDGAFVGEARGGRMIRIDGCTMSCSKCEARIEVNFDPPITDDERAEAITMARATLDGWRIDSSTGTLTATCPRHK